MQILISCFLLIQCSLVLLVYGECPAVRECMNCSGDAECVLSADNKRIECTPANTTVCVPETCDTAAHTCMATWARATENDRWFMLSRCVSSDTSDPCDSGPVCKHQFPSEGSLPDTVAYGSFLCACYGNFCNQNFLADIESVNETSSTSTVATVTVQPTPKVDECPAIRECMRCSGDAECVLSADNKRIECTPANTTACAPETCNTPFHTCMATWARATENDAWFMLSRCVSSGTSDPCDSGPVCKHQFPSEEPLPDTVAYGTFFCTCYGNFCNHNFLADIESVNETSSTSTVATVTMAPTPTVELTDRDCINCSRVSPNCTLSRDNRSLQCFIDDECVNNIIRCTTPGEVCAAAWSRQTSTSPWVADARCLTGGQTATCEGTILGEIPGSVETGSFFCTCQGALCNREFGVTLPEPDSSTISMSPTSSDTDVHITTPSTVAATTSTRSIILNSTTTADNSNRVVNVKTDGLSGNDIIAVSVSLTVVFCLIVSAILVAGFCIYARRPPKVGQRDWDQPEGGLREALSQLPVEPLEIVGNGRFGTVWKAKLHEEMVACKILSFKESKSWENEQMLYCLPSTAHPNILEYIGSEQKGQGYETQYLMVLKYCPLGSLSSYLKGHTLTWNQACNFINSALAGVAHLHAESYYDAEGICREKAPIAHRDIKSSNFLVKSDSGECVLSDLGLSLQLNPNMDVSELASIGQVGTYRYMSPEALDASVNLHDPESFKQIDMYALALVLWEIASRCPTYDGDTVPEYSLPFSREVGERANPTLDAMRTIVVHGRKRPKIPESWKSHEGLSVLAETIPECWDQDPEARLTAAGVLGRMEEALEIKGPDRQKIKLIRSQAESTSSCESGSCEQTISSISGKKCSSTSTEVTTEGARNNDNSNSYDEVVIEANELDIHNANRAEEVTVDASEV